MQEQEIFRKEGIYMLPATPGLWYKTYEKITSTFDFTRLQNNITALNSIPFDTGNRSYDMFRSSIQYLLAGYDTYSQILEGFPNYPNITQSLERDYSPARGLEDIRNGSGNRVIFLSDSHQTLGYEVGLLENPTNVCVVVFDSHIDSYFVHPLVSKNPPGKANVLRTILNKGISTVAVIGTTLESRAYFSREEQLEIQMGYVPYKDRMFITKSEIIENSVPLVSEIEHMLEEMARKGVQKLIFSIDIDVLHSTYTAREYSELSPLLLLGCQKIDHIIYEILDSKVSPLKMREELEEKVWGALDHFMYDVTGNLLYKIDPKISRLPLVDFFNGNNTLLPDLLWAIQVVKANAVEQGIELGARLKGGQMFVGDITELSGFDYANYTFDAVQHLTATLLEN